MYDTTRKSFGYLRAALIAWCVSSASVLADQPLLIVDADFDPISLASRDAVLSVVSCGKKHVLQMRTGHQYDWPGVTVKPAEKTWDLSAFAHVARWNAEEERIEMWLRADSAQRVHVRALDMTVEFAEGEEMLTEVSCKFRPDGVADELAAAGLRRTHFWTDPDGDFGLSLAVK